MQGIEDENAALRQRVAELEREHDEDQGVIRVWRGRCERAKADNAALLETVRRYVGADAVVAGHHPGAALLEYVRALEGLRKAAEDALECMEEDWPTRPATMTLRRACITFDALKERKP